MMQVITMYDSQVSDDVADCFYRPLLNVRDLILRVLGTLAGIEESGSACV